MLCAASAPPRILVVDDTWEIRHVLAELLRSSGYDVTEAADGSKALDILKQEHRERPFFALITDVVMPHLNGLELITELQALRLTVQLLIVMSAMPDFKDQALHLSRNGTATYFFSKPLCVAELLTLIDSKAKAEADRTPFAH